MQATETKIGDILESQAAEITRLACEDLFATAPDLAQHFGDDYADLWQQHFRQRVTELSSAIRTGEPRLFCERISWSRQAMLARTELEDGVSQTTDIYLSNSLDSLRNALIAVLDDKLAPAAISIISEAKASLANPVQISNQPLLDPRDPLQRISLQYLQAALEGNTPQAMQIVLEAVGVSITPKQALQQVLLDAQREIGRLWHLAEVSVAEEHLVTSTTQRTMALIAETAENAPANGKTALCASVAGNVHDLGIRTIAYLLEAEGWRAVYLGQDMPNSEIVDAIGYYDADVVLLSLALPTQISSLSECIGAVRQRYAGMPVIIGGNAFTENPGIWKVTGADGYSPDAEQAIALAEALTTPLEDEF